MDNDLNIEKVFITGVKFGVIQTLKELNVVGDDRLTMAKAYKIYGENLIKKWKYNNWISFYPSGNQKRGKYYVLKSECETAKLMMQFGNTVRQNVFDKELRPFMK